MRRSLILLLLLVLVAAPWMAGAMHHGGTQTTGHAGAHYAGSHHASPNAGCADRDCNETGGKGCCDLIAVHCAGFFTGASVCRLPAPLIRANVLALPLDRNVSGQFPEAETPPPRS